MIELNWHKAFLTVVTISLLGAALGSHVETVPLTGYTCKQNAQKPCSLCPPGYFCTDKDSMQPCGSVNFYCPLGSVNPTPVTDGFYTVGSENLTLKSSQQQCEPGYFCEGGRRILCPSGYFCPTLGLSTPVECGDSTVYCDEGSVEPTLVDKGYFSVGGTNTTRTGQQIAPKGYFAHDGLVKPCHQGHFGLVEGLNNDSCSGECEGGWFCPQASVSARQVACGGASRFCPPGSASPKMVQLGHYTSTEEEPCGPGTYRKPNPQVEVDMSPIATSHGYGDCEYCPEGTFKAIAGDSLALCLDCGTKAKSTPDRVTCECHQSATEKALYKVRYDPVESKCYDPSDGLQADDFHAPETQVTKTKELPCEQGYFCQDGTRYKCPGGRYGDSNLEVSKDCGGSCKEGHWCGEASTSPTENKCGGPNVFCPEESSTPVYVSEGYHTDEEEPYDMKTSQQICPKGYWCEDGLRYPCEAGTFGETSGLSNKDCDGSCLAGYFCLSASTSSHQYPCGNATVYCPPGSPMPILVEDGYYSASENDIIVADFYAGQNATQQIQVLCEKGFYCKDGRKYSCPAGTYGLEMGASDVAECEPCSAGMYCPSHPGPPTTEETQVPCGESYLYCPQGSPKPIQVDSGYYSITEFADERQDMEYSHLRTAQVECEPGYYCQDGIRQPCRPGTYGEVAGIPSDAHCKLCPRGFFCPENSVKPLPCSPGAYSTGSASECISCEIPLTVPAEIVNSMCRDDRSCCLEVFD